MTSDLGFGLFRANPENSPVLESINKHLTVLHHRNWQLRSAILAKSEDHTVKRLNQFVTVLHSYVRLIVLELHGPIEKANQYCNAATYVKIKKETFSGYEKIVASVNITSAEVLNQHSDFARELFKIELLLKQYQEMQTEVVYPIFLRTQ